MVRQGLLQIHGDRRSLFRGGTAAWFRMSAFDEVNAFRRRIRLQFEPVGIPFSKSIASSSVKPPKRRRGVLRIDFSEEAGPTILRNRHRRRREAFFSRETPGWAVSGRGANCVRNVGRRKSRRTPASSLVAGPVMSLAARNSPLVRRFPRPEPAANVHRKKKWAVASGAGHEFPVFSLDAGLALFPNTSSTPASHNRAQFYGQPQPTSAPPRRIGRPRPDTKNSREASFEKKQCARKPFTTATPFHQI